MRPTRYLLFILLTGLAFSCGTSTENSDATTSLFSNPETSAPVQEEKETEPAEIRPEAPVQQAPSIRLYEDSIGFLPLPFPVAQVEPSLDHLFEGYSVKQETGHQDGPDFFMHTVYKGDKVVGYFAMEAENRYNLEEVVMRGPEFSDQYSVSPGDHVAKVLAARTGGSVLIMDHFQFVLNFPNSNLSYHISGEYEGPNSDWEMGQELPAEDLSEWEVESLIWQPLKVKKPGK